jgi:hypothetical protein
MWEAEDRSERVSDYQDRKIYKKYYQGFTQNFSQRSDLANRLYGAETGNEEVENIGVGFDDGSVFRNFKKDHRDRFLVFRWTDIAYVQKNG